MNTQHAWTHSALTRITTIALGICSLMVLSGCTIHPLDGSSHRSNMTPINFIGLTPEPYQKVVLEIFSPESRSWQSVQIRHSSDTPISTRGIADRSFGSEWYPVSFDGKFPHHWTSEPDGRYSLSYRLYLLDSNGTRLEMPSFKSLPNLQPGETLYDYLVANSSEKGYGTIYTDVHWQPSQLTDISCHEIEDEE